MSEAEENIEPQINTKQKKSLFGRLFKWFSLLMILLILLIAGLLFFIQTDYFDKLALGIALDKINASLTEKDAIIYAESLTGNLLKGFTLNNGSIKVKGDTLLKFTSIHADYSILALLNKEISVQNLILKEPQINITDVKDKNDSVKWNIAYLLESGVKDEDTTASEFNWGITAENLTIENGAVRILEDKNSTLPIREIVMQKLDTFRIGKLDLTELNLNISAKYFPGSKSADIKKLSFRTNSDFNLNNFTLNAEVNEKDSVTKIKNFTVLTDRSDFRINELTMNKFEPFDAEDYENFDNNNVKLDLESQRFNFKDLTFFLPQINFLDSTIALRLIAEGNYGDLQIDSLNLKMPNSNFDFTGNVKNLNNPSEIYFDITGNNIVISPHDTRLNLPGLPIPDYSYLGEVRIPSLKYKGTPERFDTDYDIRTSAGNALGNAYFDLTYNEIRYKGDVSTTNFNIGKIVKDKELESDITGNFKVDAMGFDYKTARGKLNYKINRTKFLGFNISGSDGILNFNRGDVGLNITLNSDALHTKAEGKINISNIKNISYNLKGTATNLNIAAFTKDISQLSDLNFDFDINGRGFDPNTMSGKFNINLNPSVFAGLNIPATPLNAEIDQNGNIRNISLNTAFADLKIDGILDISTLTKVISNNIEKIKSELTSGINTDSVESSNKAVYSFSAACNNLNFNYSVNVKDLKPLYSFTGNDTIDFKGNLEGSLSDSCGVFYFVSKGLIRELSMKDSLLITDSALIDINIRNDINEYQLSGLDAIAVVKANRLIVSKFGVDTTMARISFSKNNNVFNLWTQKDSSIKLFTEGSLKDSLIVNFDSLAFMFQNILLTNNNRLVLKYNSQDSSQSIEFRKFVINSLNQKLSVAGKYSLTDSSDIKLSASNVDLGTYQKYFRDDPDTSNMVLGRIRYFDVSYKGTLKNPQIELSAVSELLSVGSTQIGRLDANIKFADDDLVSNINFYNRQNTGNFSLLGNIPIILNFSNDVTDSLQRLNIALQKEVNLNAVAKNFQLRVFQELLPYTQNLSGILDGKISLLGTSEKPILTGKMDVNNGKVGVTLTKMNYGFWASLSTDDEKLIIRDSRIFEPSDKTRFISASGYVDFTGLKMNDLMLEMTGDMKAFDRDLGETQLGISGDLWVGSGKNKLTLRGNSDRFNLTGNLILVKGNVVFNPFVQEAYNIYSDDFNYGVIIDSLIGDSLYSQQIIRQNTDSVYILKNINLNPFEKTLYTYENKELKKTAKGKPGKFFYDINVTTSENVFLKFIVNEKSQQEFFGEITTDDLNIYNYVDYTMMGRGTVTLGTNCYYKFFKKFDATGSTTFFGPISNPRLNITAQYKGYASSGTDASGQDNLEDVIIDMKVTGEAASPVLTISIDKNGVKETGSNATSDAIAFLLFGKFSDQLSFGESSSFGAALGASYLSNYVSSSIEQILPWLINTSIGYVDNKGGTLAQNTDVRFTAAIGDAVIRFGGQIFRGLANTDIVLDYPVNKLLKMKSLSNNIYFRFERVYDPFYNNADVTNTNGTRIGGMFYYKFKF